MAQLIHIPEQSIKDNLHMAEIIDLMENVFLHPEYGNMVPKIYLEEGLDGNDFRAMPARYGNYAGIKWAALFPQNGKKGHGPSVSASIIINSLENGRPLAMMDGMLITSYRTAAVTGLATKYLSNEDSQTAAFIGCGFQTKFQIEAVLNTRDIKHVKLFDLDEDKAVELSKDLASEPYANRVMRCTVCESIEECVSDSDIVTTLTPSRRPFVNLSWIASGTHINAIGADAEGKQEFHDNLADICDICVVDDKEQGFHSGESQHSYNKERFIDLFDAVQNPIKRMSHEVSLFDSTGLAIEDVALAGLIYENFIGG